MSVFSVVVKKENSRTPKLVKAVHLQLLSVLGMNKFKVHNLCVYWQVQELYFSDYNLIITLDWLAWPKSHSLVLATNNQNAIQESYIIKGGFFLYTVQE